MTSEQNNRPLPQGWRWVRLGEVCEQDRRIVEPCSDVGAVLPYLSLEHVESNTGRILREPAERVQDEGKSTTFAFDSRHVLYGKLRPYLNKVALPDFAGRCTTEIIPLLPKNETDRHYLAWLLRRDETVNAAMRQRTGSRMPRVDMDDLLSLQIPLPPPEEQKRIAAILNEQMAAAERARAAAEARLEAAKALPAAYLRAVFSSPEAQQWPMRRLREVCEFLDSRRVPVNDSDRAKRTAGKKESELFPYYGANGQVGWIDGYLFNEPLILLAEDGGNFGSADRPIAYDVRGRYWVNNHAHVLRPRDGVDFDFCLQALRIRPDVGDLVSGSTRAKLNQEIAASIPIPLPPLEEQKRIAAMLNEQTASAEQARKAIEQELDTVNKLPAALLRRAFNGEL